MMSTANSKSDIWVFTLFVFTIFYSTGAGFLESFVNYPLWKIIGPSDAWPEYRRALGPKIIPVLAVPSLLISLILNVALFFKRPLEIPVWTVWTCLGFLVVAFISTITIQLPIQAKLDKAYSPELLNDLITSSFWLREMMSLLRIVIIFYMMVVAYRGGLVAVQPNS